MPSRKPTCYVCSRVIRGEPVYIGKDLHRHQRCEPGTIRWFEAQDKLPAEKRSELFDLFVRPKKEDEGHEEESDTDTPEAVPAGGQAEAD